MHDTVMQWVAKKVDECRLWDKYVLELGSRNINGSVRQFFNGKYVGIDMIAGEDVDIVCDSWNLPYKAQTFDVVVCTEMLEHDARFWETIEEARRVLKNHGHFLVTTRGIGFPFHEYPGDFWRFTEDGIAILLHNNGFVDVQVEPDPGPSGVFAHAQRG